MKRLISIVCLCLLLLQAIPVLHFFATAKAVFYAYVDEEKPEQKSGIGLEEANREVAMTVTAFAGRKSKQLFSRFVQKHQPSPLLEFLTTPPDVC